MTNGKSLSLGIKNYLTNNVNANEKILILISCGLDSTVLFNLIIKSKYFKNKNIYYLIFDHQKRSEGKFEINKFTEFYKLLNKNLVIKKISKENKSKGFQEKSRSVRFNYLYKFSKKKNIKNVFLGHHLDDLNETFFIRKIQQSGTAGLSNIFSDNYNDLKLHRPLTMYSKKQIKSYAIRKKIVWFEDRSNYELEYTRNKVRYFLNSKKLLSKIHNERLIFSKASHIKSLHYNFFKRKRKKLYEIEKDKFNQLNENLKFLVIQAFYYENRYFLKKRIRDENIRNFIVILKTKFKHIKERSVFSGKIGAFKKKIYINLT